MKKHLSFGLSILLILTSLFLGGQVSNVTAKGQTIMEFNTMVGLPSGMTGTKSPIRGINGGGLPWMLSSGVGELSSRGHLEIMVQGLVLAAGTNAGSNPIPSFRAIVSCLTSDGSPDNILTAAFPATTGPASSGGGDAKFEGDLVLPQPCIAPIVFITSPGGAWFAATGHWVDINIKSLFHLHKVGDTFAHFLLHPVIEVLFFRARRIQMTSHLDDAFKPEPSYCPYPPPKNRKKKTGLTTQPGIESSRWMLFFQPGSLLELRL
jgi:hypothetical protein